MKYIITPIVNGSANAPGAAPNKKYLFAAAHSSKVMAVRNGQIFLEQANWNERAEQLWKIEALTGADSGFVRIVNTKSGKVMDVKGGSTGNGAELIEWAWHGGHNQQFKLQRLNNGRYRVLIRKSGKVLDVSGGSKNQGAGIIQWPWHGGPNQQWALSTADNFVQGVGFDARATVYQHANFGGKSQVLGIGSYNMADIRKIGNDQISSLKVPSGLKVTLYEHANFRGRKKAFTADTGFVGHDFNDLTSGIVVEQVASFYQHSNFRGAVSHLGIGTYKMRELGIGNDQISSLKVPQGIMVTVYEHENFKGRFKVFTENASWIGNDFNDKTSSIVVKAMGIVIPRGALKYGDKVVLKGVHGKYFSGEADGDLMADRTAIGSWEQFTITRSGPTKHQSYVSFGDTISLKTVHGKYVVAELDGTANANRTAIGSWEKFILLRSGNSLHNNFVSPGDTISLKTTHGKYIVAEADGRANANRTAIGSWEKFTIRTKSVAVGSVSSGPQSSSNPACGEQVGTAASVCATDVCGADACGAAACGIAIGGLRACGAASTGFAICGADVAGAGACGVAVAGVSACGVAAAGVTVGGVGVCGADACGAAACGAAACGAAACGAAGCGAAACGAAASVLSAEGADVCGIEVNVAEACAAEASAIEACLADACGANVCAINACPADACAADACAIDVIPIIPGI